MSDPVRFPLPHLAATVAACAILACGGDSSGPKDPDPEPVTVTVQLTTAGEDLDPDGYRLALGTTTREVGVAGSMGFTGVVPGTYDLVVSGLSPNCSVDGGATRQVTVTGTMQVTLAVNCVSVLLSGLYTDVACPALTPGAAGGAPMAPVALGALPPQLEEPLYARVTGSGSDAYALGFVERAPDGTASTRIPLLPSGSLDGGAVSVRIAGGRYACSTPVTFQVAGLPPAPGETAAIVDLMEELIEAQASRLGTSAAAMRAADPATVPEALLPLYIVTTVVDHPQNPNSLRAILQGTAPLVAGGSLEVADRLLAWSGLRDALEASLPPAASPLMRAAAADLDAGDCLTGAITLASELHECMSIANDAAFKMDGMSGQVQDDLITALGYASNVPYPPAKAAAAIMGAAMVVADKLQEGTAMLLPRSFLDIKVTATPQQFMEDEEGTGNWEAEVRATSAGWQIDKAILEILSQIANLSGALYSWLKSYLAEAVEQVVLAMVLNAAVNTNIDLAGGSDIFKIEPQEFGPVDVSDEEWSERSLIPDDIFQFTGHTSYVPNKAGQADLVVRTRAGLFGNQQITGDPALDLEVKEIGIRLLDGNGAIGPVVIASDSKRNFTFTVEVTNSKHPDQIAFEPPSPLKGGALFVPGNPALLHYEAPTDLSQLPDILVVRHTATTGARASGTPARFAMVEIRQAGIVVTPGEVCLAPGATQQFDAAVLGLDNDGVTWSASTGSITVGGLYTAPAGLPVGTEVTITATSSQDEELKGTAIVTVGCVCSFSVTVGGTTYDSKPGDRIVYFFDVLGTQGLFYVQLRATALDRSISLPIEGLPTAPGIYPVKNAIGKIAYDGQYGYLQPSGDEITFYLQEYLPHTALVGTFTGTVRDAWNPSESPPMALSVTFHAYPKPGEGGLADRFCDVPAGGGG